MFSRYFQAVTAPGHIVFDDFIRHIEDILATRGLTYFIVFGFFLNEYNEIITIYKLNSGEYLLSR